MPSRVRFFMSVFIVEKDPTTCSAMSEMLFEKLAMMPMPGVFSYSSVDERPALILAGEAASSGSSEVGVIIRSIVFSLRFT